MIASSVPGSGVFWASRPQGFPDSGLMHSFTHHQAKDQHLLRSELKLKEQNPGEVQRWEEKAAGDQGRLGCMAFGGCGVTEKGSAPAGSWAGHSIKNLPSGQRSH